MDPAPARMNVSCVPSFSSATSSDAKALSRVYVAYVAAGAPPFFGPRVEVACNDSGVTAPCVEGDCVQRMAKIRRGEARC